MVELARKGLLLKYIVASLFRVTVGFTLAALVGIPAGLALGWFRPWFLAFNPIIQVFRPISPIAWIPVAILWFGVDDRAPIFLSSSASVFSDRRVVDRGRAEHPAGLHARARNFGLTGMDLFRRVIFPATLPQVDHRDPDRARRRVARGGRRRDDRRQLRSRVLDHRRPQRRQAVRPRRRRHGHHRLIGLAAGSARPPHRAVR